MNSTANTKDDLIARADEQIASAYEKIAHVDKQLARMSAQPSTTERDAANDPSIVSASQPPRREPARRRLIGLLSAGCAVGVVVAVVLQSSHGRVPPLGAQWPTQLISTPSSSSDNPPPAQSDPSVVQVTAEEATPPQAAPSLHAGAQEAATVATASELMQLLQKMTSDIANLDRALEQLRAKQDQIASDNGKAIEQLKAKQEDMARQLAQIAEQSALHRSSPPSARPAQSPQVRMRPQPSPSHTRYPAQWRYYDDEW